MKRVSLNAKIDALSKIGVMRQYTLEERLAIYDTYPDEYKQDAINEAMEFSAKGFICNVFTVTIQDCEEVVQWQKPSIFISNCYKWFISDSL